MEKNEEKIGIYVRVSTENQAAGDKYSIQLQKTDGIEFAHKLGFSYEIFEDHKSGGDVTRDGWQKLGEAIDLGIITHVWCSKIDRFSRDTESGVNILKRMQKAQTHFYIHGAEYSVNEPMIVYMLTMLFGQANFEKDYIKQRTMDGKIAKRNAGNRISIDIYGYNRISLKNGYKTVEVNKDEADVVKQVFNWYVNDNMSISDIKKKLISDAHQSKYHGKIYKMKSGEQRIIGDNWQYSSIRQLLKHPEYIGETYKADGITRRGSNHYLGFIDKDIWEKAQEISNTKRKRYDIKTGYRITNHFCSGVIQCEKCEAKYYFRDYKSGGSQNRKTDFVYYVHKKLKPQEISCLSKATILPLKLVEEIFDIIYFEVFANPDELIMLYTEQAKGIRNDIEELQKDSDRVSELIDTINIKLKNLTMAIENGIDISTIKTRIHELSKDKQRALDSLADKRKAVVLKNNDINSMYSNYTTESVKEYQSASGDRKRVLLRTVIQSALITDDRNDYHSTQEQNIINKILKIKTVIGQEYVINLSLPMSDWFIERIAKLNSGGYNSISLNEQRKDTIDYWQNMQNWIDKEMGINRDTPNKYKSIYDPDYFNE